MRLIDEAAERLETLTSHLAGLNAEHAPIVDVRAQEITLREVKQVEAEDLGSLPAGRINQWLHALLGRQRLSVRDGQIEGIVREKKKR